MAISPTCDACGVELDHFGGIVLSPPNSENAVSKYHVCKNCYEDIEGLLQKKQP